MAAPIMVAALALALAAGSVPADERETLAARIYDTVGLPEDQRATMLRVAADALSPAGIEMAWKRCVEITGVDCPSPDGGAILVRIVERHGGADSGRCGFAMVERGHGFVSLALDCAERTLESLERRWMPLDLQPLTTGEVLGYLLAHEIAHVLLPGAEHSVRGLFKARLHARDWKSVRREGLTFSPEVVARLREAAFVLAVSRAQDGSHVSTRTTRTPATRSDR